MDVFQVAQDARQDLFRCRTGEVVPLERRVVAEGSAQAHDTLLRGHETALERVDQKRALPHVAQEEVSREVHAFHVQFESSRDFDVQDGKRDRDTRPPLEHLVQVAVARVVVFRSVADEAHLLEQEPVQPSEPLGDAGTRAPKPGARLLGQRVEPAQVMRHVQVGTRLGRDQERPLGEVDLVVAPRRKTRELLTCGRHRAECSPSGCRSYSRTDRRTSLDASSRSACLSGGSTEKSQITGAAAAA